MDPISTIFSIYLETVSRQIRDSAARVMNTEVTPVVIHYKGIDIPFQHPLWKIRASSVCEPYRQALDQFSRCTVAAKEMFRDLCDELARHGHTESRYRNMYCNAAISFRPTIADVSAAEPLSPLELARQACNAATAAGLGSTDPALIAEREGACAEYENLKMSTAE